MKIKCIYCENMINDTEAVCPFCGAPNEHVVRSTKTQPKTIEELKAWYADRKLPPYETTRFFIGVDYRQPRAFGIYKDETTGNFIVYKNKDTGARAVRYQGTDEAYAVNELYMRLKQEIIEQKKGQGGAVRKAASSPAAKAAGEVASGIGFFAWQIIKTMAILFGGAAALLAVVCIGVEIFDHEPSNGYYNYNGQGYYYFYSAGEWFKLDEARYAWDETPIDNDQMPEELQSDKTAEPYYLSYDWNENLGMPGFETCSYYVDYNNSTADTGYYDYAGTTYYNMNGSFYDGWYEYDGNDWNKVDDADLPDDLTRYSTAEDFYTTSSWDPSLQASDFTDTEEYQDYQEQLQEEQEKSDDWNNNSDDNSSYDWSDSDSWDSGGTDWGSDW